MSETVDARGLSCPVPVIKTKAALEAMTAGELTVLLDEEVAKENVSRLARSMKCSVDVAEDAGEYTLTIRKDAAGE
jgi:TusA-related sulfurtransferase